MNNTDQVEIKVSPALIQPLIEAKVQAAIIQALGEEAHVVEQVVGAALTQKCTESGKRSEYSSDNKFTFLEAMCRSTIRQAAKDALCTFLATKQDLIRDELVRQLETKKMRSKLVGSIVDGLAKATENKYRFTLELGE